MIKKLILIFFFLFIPLNVTKALALPVEVTADSVALINADTGDFIYGKNEDKVEIMASLTKLMTAYAVINNVNDLNTKVTITEADIANLAGFTCAGIKVGDRVSYTDLLYALILLSAADAAQSLAYHTSGSLNDFKNLMNDEAQKLGLTKSHFEDSYGGDDNNVSTAREMSVLLRKCLENSTFKKIFTTKNYTLSTGLEVKNYTPIFAQYHGLDPDLITGSKSGYTPEAGLLLASTSTIDGQNYILVTCKSALNEKLTTHVLDSYKVYQYIKDHHYENRVVLKKGEELKKIKVDESTTSEYITYVDKDVSVFLNDEEASRVKVEPKIVEEINSEYKKGDILGYVDITLDGEVLKSYYVYLNDEIFPYEEPSKVVIVIIILFVFFIILLFTLNILMFRQRT